MCVCVFYLPVCRCFVCVQCLQRPEGVGTPGTWVTDACEPISVGNQTWSSTQIKPGPLPKQLVLPTPEPVSRKAFCSGPFIVWDLQRSSLVEGTGCKHMYTKGLRAQVAVRACVCACISGSTLGTSAHIRAIFIVSLTPLADKGKVCWVTEEEEPARMNSRVS